MTLLGGAAASSVSWPLAARAQEPVASIVSAFLFQAEGYAALLAFFDELRLNGFVEGQNLLVVPGGFESATSSWPNVRGDGRGGARRHRRGPSFNCAPAGGDPFDTAHRHE